MLAGSLGSGDKAAAPQRANRGLARVRCSALQHSPARTTLAQPNARRPARSPANAAAGIHTRATRHRRDVREEQMSHATLTMQSAGWGGSRGSVPSDLGLSGLVCGAR